MMILRQLTNRWIAMMAGTAVSMLAAASAWGCPNCADALKDDPSGLAFFWSTLFMMAMPYSIALTVGGGLFYVYWRAERKAPAPQEIESVSWPVEGSEKEGGR